MCCRIRSQRGARLGEMGAFPSQDVDRGFRHAKSSDARSVGTGSGGPGYSLGGEESTEFFRPRGVPSARPGACS